MASKMAHNLCGSIHKFVAAALCAKVVCLSISLDADCFLLVHGHTTDGVDSHGYHLLEFSIFKPQDSVGNFLDSLVM
jgi:hypothetical protein